MSDSNVTVPVEQILIIGSGPAGLTAAIYAARADMSPIVVSGMQPGGQLTQTTDIENFPGFENGIGGSELVETMRRQAERFGTKFLNDEVKSIIPGNPHEVVFFSGKTVKAKSIIVATGASARYLGLESEEKYKGKGVSACATCDGAFYRGRDVVVVGGGDTAMEDSLFLTRFCKKVTIIHRRDSFRASKVMAERVISNEKIEVKWNSVVEEILGNDVAGVSGIRIKNVQTGALSEIQCDGVFVAIGHTPNTGAFKGVLELDPEGFLIADARGRTNINGIFAAGDVADRHYKQAITASGTGCAAALEAERWLTANK